MANDASKSEKPTEPTNEKQAATGDKANNDQKDDKQPAGGYDSTPLPRMDPGWTVKFTFHRATNLPMADIHSTSSDPYILAKVTSLVPPRHKEDPDLMLRTPTVRRNTDPEWNCEWVVANIPSSGCTLRAFVYDEDPADHDDRLGHVHVDIAQLTEAWPGISNQAYKVKKKYGSKRAYAIRAVATCFRKAKHMNGNLYLSVELLGRTKDDHGGGRMYTLGPCWFTRHYSPMLGRLANLKEPGDDHKPKTDVQSPGGQSAKKSGQSGQSGKTHKYNFEANQLQLKGPTPAPLYHRYVEFKPFVRGMFTKSGIRGFLLAKALHHQHNRVYNFSQTTTWGRYDDGPSKQMTLDFLKHCHYDKGGRIFTYCITLDALFRFTETGKEFGIDMLSKHSMHSDVDIYIAFSGELFIRRLEHRDRPPPPDPPEETSQTHPEPSSSVAGENRFHPPADMASPSDQDPTSDPSYYELIIDNDSGTYRPNADLLPVLREFLAANLPGLHIQTLDCKADSERMNKWKTEQRERKKSQGNQVVFTQGNGGSAGSISTSDEEELDRVEAGGAATSLKLRSQIKKDAGLRGKDKIQHLKRNNPKHERTDPAADAPESEEKPAGA